MNGIRRWWAALAAAVVLALGVACPAAAQEIGYTLRETEVRAKPFLDAEVVAKLPEKAEVTIVSRQSGWTQVKQGATRGWVRMLSLRLGNPDPKKDTSFLAALGFGRPRPAGVNAGTSVTTGVRGFSEEELKVSKPDPEQLKKMGENAVAAGDAEQFSREGKLASRAMPYVDADGEPLKEGK